MVWLLQDAMNTQENCWKLHGKSTNWKNNISGPSGTNHAVDKANEANFLSAEQMDHLLQLLKSTSASSLHISSLAQTGENSSAYRCSLNLAPWIIDLVHLITWLVPLSCYNLILPVLLINILKLQMKVFLPLL